MMLIKIQTRSRLDSQNASYVSQFGEVKVREILDMKASTNIIYNR